MGFVQGEDDEPMEDVMAETLAAVGVDHEFPLQRMQYSEAMERFGNDRPDTRFGMELHDITDIVKDTGFKVFERGAVRRQGGRHQREGRGRPSRGDVEKLADIAAENGARRAWPGSRSRPMAREKSPIIKFFSDEEFAALKEAMGVEPGDLLLFARPPTSARGCHRRAGARWALRLHMAEALNAARGPSRCGW